jgi:organic radical activating enzyme
MTMPGVPAAALAGVPAGVQAQGVWVGRRQLFIKFAAEAETATMYSADALARDLGRQVKRGVFHSVSITGRDPLANREFLEGALSKAHTGLPVMLDIDGQRPEEVERLAPALSLIQVTLDPGASDATLQRAADTMRVAQHARCAHAFVASARAETSDAQILRVVGQMGVASADTDVILLPPAASEQMLDRRWAALLEQAMQTHPRVTIGTRIFPPAGMR